ncbi:CoA transferase subunit A [Ramlibacter sp. AN1133]|uniref:CoA transferase subunit A n=1 Tax=Ramlibacter sp. AN1133 TaxID=3133429 RepID=UPI0030C2BBBA
MTEDKLWELEAVCDVIRDGDQVAIPTGFNAEFSAVAMDVTRALIRRRAKGLRLLCVPTSGLQADMLIGAGCVSSIEMGAVLLYEYGAAPRFGQAQREGSIEILEATCPAIAAGLRAGEAGLPFMPVPGILGSDVYRVREPNWKQIRNPFNALEQSAVVPALRPDVAVFHSPLADRYGNVWIGRRGSLRLMAHASRRCVVTCDELYEGDLLDHSLYAPGSVSGEYITAVCHRPGGSWPLHAGAAAPEDRAHMHSYAELAATPEGFASYLRQHVLQAQ